MSGEGWSPADRQAATWWSHLATQSQPQTTGRRRVANVLPPFVSLPEGLRDGRRQQDPAGGRREPPRPAPER